MLKAIEGIYHDDDGKIELSDMPGDIHGKIRVIVTFLGRLFFYYHLNNKGLIDGKKAIDVLPSICAKVTLQVRQCQNLFHHLGFTPTNLIGGAILMKHSGFYVQTFNALHIATSSSA
ncbi:MAG: hypothetical protein AAGB97_02985 [Dehalococcoidia bacterium]|nr:hypothetical protein [Chloroflexota bacterium]MBT9160764.1 hypothetical protein [Chloroflexota bacterium]MBT9161548.1 hypothetical protein [Chloroflexota bacterium]